MFTQHWPRVLSAALVCVSSAVLLAGPTYINPKEVDDDYAIQGEYAGELKTDEGKEKFGIQLIALGKAKFQVVGYHGGLPGDGWNGEKVIRIEAAMVDGVLVAKDEHGSGTLKDGVFTIKGPDGDEFGKLKKVTRVSPTMGAKPPQDAVVLFDGKDAKQWKNGKVTEDGLLEQGTETIPEFSSHTLHIEFLLPYKPEDRGQGRGNSGLYLQARYEVQMLDSFGLAGKDNECGGIYSIKDPDLNMCFPPLTWQTYDVDFTAAKYDGDKLVSNPKMTVRHNGVVIHKDVELPKSTTAAPRGPGVKPGPIYLQNHGNPVRFRNIWVSPK
ncbi:MAG: hypothetical protein ACI9HK_002128 [Pirellulaceae bacterium]|jgi:hypothetical protein